MPADKINRVSRLICMKRKAIQTARDVFDGIFPIRRKDGTLLKRSVRVLIALVLAVIAVLYGLAIGLNV